MNKNNKSLLQVLNLLAIFATIFFNYLANALPIGGRLTGEISDSYPNLFTPAGITFAIWGIIYLLLVIFGLYQARDLFKKEKIVMPFLDKISYYFVLSSMANILWIFAWHYEQIFLSLFLMVVIFSSLLKIYLELNIGKTISPKIERFFVQIPFSVYLGWITVATIANVTVFLASIGWEGLGLSDVIWTMIVIIVALIITLIIIITRKDVAYALVIVWALLGIYIKSADELLGVQSEIALTAAISALIIVLAIIIEVGADKLLRKQKT